MNRRRRHLEEKTPPPSADTPIKYFSEWLNLCIRLSVCLLVTPTVAQKINTFMCRPQGGDREQIARLMCTLLNELI